MTAASKLTPKRREKFLAKLATSGNVSAACGAANITRDSAYNLKKRDRGFAAAWESALEHATDLLEEEARRRAYDGVARPLHFQGKLTGDTMTEYSDRLLTFLLRGHRPERFSDRHQISGPDGGPVQVAGGLSDDAAALIRSRILGVGRDDIPQEDE